MAQSATSCQFTILASVEFTKSTMLKGRIETEVWGGQQKSVDLLEEHLLAATSSSTSSVSSPTLSPRHQEEAVARGQKEERQARVARPARVKLYPDNYQYTGQLILSLILLILSMLVVALFKLTSTLEKMDQRLSNIEQAFTALSIMDLTEQKR